jgi:SPP1 gp7 family putative phage head morphogenesis protein
MPAWPTTADPSRFPEAVDFFLGRVVVTSEQAKALDIDAQNRAFWIGGGLQLEQIQRVHDEINKAIATGERFEDWRKRVREDLKTHRAHTETVFRNAVQRSYNAGRYEQMNDPEVAKVRPFWMYDAILDDRTTEVICRPRDGVTLPRDHQWWQNGNIPPLHHRCRSGIRNLRKAEADRRGITTDLPDQQAKPGWGLPPAKQPVWKPTAGTHEPKLVAELERKEKRKKKPEPTVVEVHQAKFQEGVHVRSFYKGKRNDPKFDAQVDETLSALTPDDLALLEKRPLNDLYVAPTIRSGGFGVYYPAQKRMEISTTIDDKWFNLDWEGQETYAIASAAKSAAEFRKITLIHELGHHVHESLGPAGDKIVQAAFDKAKNGILFGPVSAITKYGKTDRYEYFAESFAAHRYRPDDLKALDPGAYQMVEEVLQLHKTLPVAGS